MISLGYDLLTPRSDLDVFKPHDVMSLDSGTLQLLIARSTADQEGEGCIAFSLRRSTELLQRWLKWREDDIYSLFCPIYQNAAVDRHLSATTVVRVTK
ncbi:MAG: hypothetical protein KGK00_08580 [Paracoccaceae bacterium]|nr:hypothetical protein [Paracoccaceae bacterium]